MSKSGDSKAADALARVPGLTVQGGKFVFVRGLGDRYTKTTLNGMQIPGLDPDRNTVQLDIFPTSVIDNITVYKAFTPDMAGDLAGGLINISTKDFPTEQELKFNIGTSANTASSFNSQFLTYQGGKTDYLGFDDGTRKLPVSPKKIIPNPVSQNAQTETATKSFSGTMGTQERLSLLNHNYGLSFGDVSKNIFKKDGMNYGYNFSLNYNNSNSMKQDAIFGDYLKSDNSEVNELSTQQYKKGNISENEVLWTALFGNSIRFNNNNKLSLNLFHTQNGVSSASNTRNNNIENPAVLVQQNLQYTERRVTNVQLIGKHTLAKKLNLDWSISPTMSKIDDPDMRSSRFEEITRIDEDGNEVITYDFNESVGSEMRRTFRTLNEVNLDGRADLTYKFRTGSDSLPSKLKFGGAAIYKQRDYAVYNYLFNFVNVSDFTNDPDMYFREENIWTKENNQGTYATGLFEKENIFSGTQAVAASYLMHDFMINKKLKAVYGVRGEYATSYYTGFDATTGKDIQNLQVLNNLDVLPSANFVYKMGQKATDSTSKTKSNFRFGYAKTVARPSFKEKSTVSILDPISGRRFIGNVDLKATDIHNLDLRWEHFFGNTELISASTFYKRFINPIENATYANAPSNVTSVNAGTADVFGLELEVRKSLDFLFKAKEGQSLMIGANYNYIVSRVDMDAIVLNNGNGDETEREVRQKNARDGETIGRYRAMFGQSPYAFNSFLTYSDADKGTNLNMSYNVQGKRLSVVGIGRIADVFEMPFHSLNIKGSKSFGKQNRWTGSLSVRNLLMNTRKFNYQSFGSEDKTYFSYNPGMTISAGISLKLR